MERGDFHVRDWTDCVLATSCISHIGRYISTSHLHICMFLCFLLIRSWYDNNHIIYKRKLVNLTMHHDNLQNNIFPNYVYRESWWTWQGGSSSWWVPCLQRRLQVLVGDGQVWKSTLFCGQIQVFFFNLRYFHYKRHYQEMAQRPFQDANRVTVEEKVSLCWYNEQTNEVIVIYD